MQIKLRDLATAPDGRICFDYTIDLQKEEVNFEHPFEEPVRLVGEVRDNAGVISLDSEVEAVVHTRCARCTERCRTETPCQHEVEPGHYVVCHLYE